MTAFNADATAQIERALLGSVLLENSLWPQTAELSADDFFLDSHRKIFRRMAVMFEDQRPVDVCTLLTESQEANGSAAYLGSLIDDAYPENFDAYVRSVREAATERRFARLQERLAETKNHEQRQDLLRQMQELLAGNHQARNWQSIFHTYEEILHAPPLKFAIPGFLQQDAVTFIGGLAGHGKTMVMLNMVKAMIEGEPLFNYHPFKVTEPSQRVLYLIPESSIGPFVHRLKLFRLLDHVRDQKLFVRTLNAKRPMESLGDPDLLCAVKGADVFLDTAIRFMDGEENSASDQRIFAQMLFQLQTAGARTIVGAHHSPKGLANASCLTLENVLRGTGDIGAMLATCWGIFQTDPSTNTIVLKNVKPRDFGDMNKEFHIQGRPYLDNDSHFQIVTMPGEAAPLNPQEQKGKVGRPETEDKDAKLKQAQQLVDAGWTQEAVAKTMGVSRTTLFRWGLKARDVS